MAKKTTTESSSQLALSRDPDYKLSNFYVNKKLLAKAKFILENKAPDSNMSLIVNELLEKWVAANQKTFF